MPKNKRLMSGLLAVPLVTILLIAGCSVGSPEPTETPNPSPSISAPADPSATPAPSQTEEPPAPDVSAGTVVDGATAEALNNAGGQYRGYQMPDGSYVVVDRAAPVPEPVQQDINNKGENLAQKYPTGLDSHSPSAGQDRGRIIGEIQQATGKKTILIVRDNVFQADGVTQVTNYYATGGGIAPDGTIRNKDEIAAFVNAFLSDKNANDYVVVWPN